MDHALLAFKFLYLQHTELNQVSDCFFFNQNCNETTVMATLWAETWSSQVRGHKWQHLAQLAHVSMTTVVSTHGVRGGTCTAVPTAHNEE